MINVKPIIVAKLKTINDNVVDVYPSDFSTFPIIQYYEEENIGYAYADGRERLASITIRVDVWHNRSTSDLSIAVDSKMLELGLKRTFSSDMPDPNCKHKVMRFTGIVDVDTLQVYDK